MRSISRRRLWSLVTLAAGLGTARAARADLPQCSRDGVYGDFQLMAYVNDKGALYYEAALVVDDVAAPTRSGKMSVGPLTYGVGHGGVSFTVVTQRDDPFPPGTKGLYEIYAGNTRIAAVPFALEDGSDDIPNQSVVAQRLLQSDSVIRLTLGRNVSQWRVSARGLSGALDRAASLGRAAQADYASRRCQGVSGDCLMTTVACRTLGLADDCFELQTVRRLRDRWLKHQPGGAAAIEWYYRIAPALLMAIPPARRERVFLRFYIARLAPAVALERLGCHALAFRWLKQGVLRLARRYRLEAMIGAV